jgi:hypothetical protein
MHLRICIDKHFDLITNLFKYKCETYKVFIYSCQKFTMNAKYNSWIMDLTHSKWMIQLMSYVDSSKDVKKHINMFKYKCEALKLCVFQYILINIMCEIWIMVSINLAHVYMLIVQEM